jgi:hypothetical protein
MTSLRGEFPGMKYGASRKPITRSCFLLLLLFGFSAPTMAQVVGDTGTPRKDLSESSDSGSKDRRSKGPEVRYVPRASVRTVTVTKVVRVTPTTGTLSVATESGAVVLIEPINGGKAKEGTVPANERQFIFNDLAPGRYRVAADLDGYHQAESEVVIKANKTSPVTLELQPITFQVTFRTNVANGEIRYQNLTTGEPPRVVPIRAGSVVLNELRTGKYDIDIRPAEVGFQTLLATITLPGKTTFDVELKRLPSTALFAETWTNLDRWDAPAGWRVQSRKLVIAGPGVALPHEENLKHYIDFQLLTDVKMLGSSAASIVIRAKDTQNYYLIQLTGAKADEPYVLRGFVVKNGERQRLQAPIPIEAFTSTIKPDELMTVLLTVKDNKFNVKIQSPSTGEVVTLGVLSDPDRTFLIGAVGLSGDGLGQSEVWRFTICTPECPRL